MKDINRFPGAKPAVWFTVNDVEAEYLKLKKKGVAFIGEPYRIGTGHAAEFEDAFGNRFGIADYIK